MQRHIRYLIATCALALPMLVLFTNMSSLPKNEVKDCTFAGQTIAHGQSVTVYQAPLVPMGEKCVSESRTCTNGLLTGSYVHPTCQTDSDRPSVQARRRCTGCTQR